MASESKEHASNRETISSVFFSLYSISGQEVKFVNSAARMGVSNPIGGENDDIDEKQLIENMD